ncbi:BrnA antitoxin family protein [Frigidibacter sp. SD6-1]|uniref:BrnA antitoxin family protein n=1 Tax=Frigidibacter sp. SD6-1 TaxID=3032581 RepID=UPI0024DFD100|nr:BrnA antitoxin family protein [Frigidibacter sp. SD6-1]
MARIAGRTKRQRAHYHHLAEALKELEFHLSWDLAASGQLPEAWQEIARQRTPSRKVRLSLWVEEEVVRFFRAMGPGHTVRMADVLRTFMHARLAGVLSGAEGVVYEPLTGAERRERIAMLQEMARLMAEEQAEHKRLE